MDEKLLRMAEKHALTTFLSEFPADEDYDDITSRMSEGDLEGILVWEPFEDKDPSQVVEHIENLKDATIELIEAVLENQ